MSSFKQPQLQQHLLGFQLHPQPITNIYYKVFRLTSTFQHGPSTKYLYQFLSIANPFITYQDIYCSFFPSEKEQNIIVREHLQFLKKVYTALDAQKKIQKYDPKENQIKYQNQDQQKDEKEKRMRIIMAQIFPTKNSNEEQALRKVMQNPMQLLTYPFRSEFMQNQAESIAKKSYLLQKQLNHIQIISTAKRINKLNSVANHLENFFETQIIEVKSSSEIFLVARSSFKDTTHNYFEKGSEETERAPLEKYVDNIISKTTKKKQQFADDLASFLIRVQILCQEHLGKCYPEMDPGKVMVEEKRFLNSEAWSYSFGINLMPLFLEELGLEESSVRQLFENEECYEWCKNDWYIEDSEKSAVVKTLLTIDWTYQKLLLCDQQSPPTKKSLLSLFEECHLNAYAQRETMHSIDGSSHKFYPEITAILHNLKNSLQLRAQMNTLRCGSLREQMIKADEEFVPTFKELSFYYDSQQPNDAQILLKDTFAFWVAQFQRNTIEEIEKLIHCSKQLKNNLNIVKYLILFLLKKYRILKLHQMLMEKKFPIHFPDELKKEEHANKDDDFFAGIINKCKVYQSRPQTDFNKKFMIANQKYMLLMNRLTENVPQDLELVQKLASECKQAVVELNQIMFSTSNQNYLEDEIQRIKILVLNQLVTHVELNTYSLYSQYQQIICTQKNNIYNEKQHQNKIRAIRDIMHLVTPSTANSSNNTIQNLQHNIT